MIHDQNQGAVSPPSEPPEEPSSPVLVPFSSSIHPSRQSSSIPVVSDYRAISRLLEILMSKAGLTVGETADRMRVKKQSIYQYLSGRRSNPSLMWFLRLAQVCGAEVRVVFNDAAR